MENIDFSQWPAWLIALLLILNLFKQPLSNLFPAILGFLNTRATVRAESDQAVAEDHREDTVAEKKMLGKLVQQSLDQNRELIGFLKTVIITRLDTMDARLDDIVNEHRDMRQEYEKVVKE